VADGTFIENCSSTYDQIFKEIKKKYSKNTNAKPNQVRHRANECPLQRHAVYMQTKFNMSAENVSDISDLLDTWQESLISEVEAPMKQFTVPSRKVNV
jgi:hypothetical protein